MIKVPAGKTNIKHCRCSDIFSHAEGFEKSIDTVDVQNCTVTHYGKGPEPGRETPILDLSGPMFSITFSA